MEEYYEEFESLRHKLEVDEPEPSLMSQFLDGLHDRIALKVERQPYEDFQDLLHYAIMDEQHIKRKTASTSRSKPIWTAPTAKAVDKARRLR